MRPSVKRALRIGAVLLGALLVGGVVFLHTRPFRSIVERQVEGLLGGALGRDVRVELVALRPLTLSAQIGAVRIAGESPRDPALLELRQATIDARWLPLLGGRVHLTELDVEGLRIDLDQLPAGDGGVTTADAPARSFADWLERIALDRARVADVHVRGRVDDNGIVIDGAALDLARTDDLPHYEVLARLPRIQARFGGNEIRSTLEAALTADPHGIEVSKLELRANGAEILATGRLEDPLGPVGQASFDVRLRPDRLQVAQIAALEGDLKARGSLRLDHERYELELDVDSPALGWGAWSATDLQMSVAGTPEGWNATYSTSVLGAAVHGQARAGGLPGLVPLEAEIAIAAEDVGRLATTLLGPEAPPLRGALSGSVSGGMGALDLAALRASFDVEGRRLGPRDAPAVDLLTRLVGSVQGQTLDLTRWTVRGSGLAAEGSGKADLDRSTEVRLSLRVEDTERAFDAIREALATGGIDAALPESVPDARGAVALDAELRGPGLRQLAPSNVEASLSLTARSLATPRGRLVLDADLLAALASGRLTLRRATLRADDASADVRGTLGLESAEGVEVLVAVPRLGATVTAALDEAEPFGWSAPSWLTPTLERIGGELRLEGKVGGPWSALSGDLQLVAAGLGDPRRSLDGTVSLDRGRFDAHAALTGDDSRIETSWQATGYASRLPSGEVRLALLEPSPEWWLALAGLSIGAEGKLEGDGSVDLGAGSGTLRLAVRDGQVGGVPFFVSELEVEGSPTAVTVLGGKLGALGGVANASGTLGSGGVLRIHGSGFELERAAEIAGSEVDLGGAVGFDAELTGTPASPALRVELALDGPTIAGRALAGLAGTATLTEGRWVIDLAEPEGTSHIRVEGGSASGAPWSLDARYPLRLDLASLASIEDEAAEALVDAELIARIRGRADDLTAIEGEVTARDVRCRLAGRSLVARGDPTLRLAGGHARLEPFELVGEGRTRIGFAGGVALAPPNDLDGTVQGDLDVGLLGALLPDTRIDGLVSVDLSMQGPALTADWGGRIVVAEGRLAHPALPASLRNVSLTVSLAPEIWSIDLRDARLGGGVLRGEAEYRAGGAEAGSIHAELFGEGVTLEPQEGLRLQADAELTLDGKLTGSLLLAGRLDVSRSSYTRDLVLEEQLLTRSRAYSGSVGIGSALERIRLDLGVRAARGAFVRNNVATAEMALDLTVGGTLADPRLNGRCDLVPGGQVTFREVDYSITRGSVRYVADPPDNPVVDVVATTTVSTYDISLLASGRLQDPQLELTSNPSLAEADIVSLLITGRVREDLASGGGGLSATQAALYLGRGITDEVEATLARSLGLDQVRIDPVLVEDAADPTARVTLGKTLTEGLSAVFSRDLSGNQTDIYELHYVPRERIELVGRRNEEDALSGDAFYTQRFYLGPARPIRDDANSVGERPVVEVTFRGNTVVGDRKLRRDLGLPRRRAFREAVLLAGLDRMRERYVYAGYPQVEIRADVARVGSGVAIGVEIDEGGRLEVQFQGVPRGKRSLRREIEQQWRRSAFPDLLAEDAVTLVGRHMRARGFANAEVEVVLRELDTEATRVEVEVERGSRVRVDGIVLEGVSALDPARIRSQILTEEAGLFRRGNLVESTLEEDRNAIRTLYIGQGFLNVDVAEPVVTYPDADDRAVVTFSVTSEGRRYRIGEVGYTGNDALSVDRLSEIAGLTEGEPFLDRDVRAARSRLRQHYDELGYPDARVELEPRVDHEDARVDVRFAVVEGERKTVGAVEVVGTALTRPQVIRRELELKPGAPLSNEALAEDQQALYRTGLFRSVAVVQQPGDDGTGVTYEVEEAPNVHTRYGFGYSTDEKLRANATVSHANLFGRRLYGSIGGRYSSTHWRAFVLGRQPRLLGTRLDGLVSTSIEREQRNAFDVRRIALNLQIGKSRRDGRFNWFVGYGLDESNVFLEGVEIIFPPDGIGDIEDDIDLRRESVIRLGNVNTGFLYTNRDDFAWPTRGWTTQAEIGLFDEAFASEADFVRLFTQATRYQRLGRNGPIWNLGARFGLADPYGATRIVPINRRFFTGGDNSIRGHAFDSIVAVGFPSDELAAAGINVEDSLGGQSLFIINQELVIPWIDPLAFALFYDAGNLYWQLDDFDLTDLRHSAGLGLRMRTPIGPLRLEYGWKLDRQPGESPGRFHISLGHAF